MKVLVGTWAPEWGHTWISRGFGRLYTLRSLAGGSFLCVYDNGAWKEFPTPGEHSCHITLLDRQAVLSDYTSGSLSLFPLNPAGIPCGKPEVLRFEGCGPNPERQASAHLHSTWISPDGGSLIAADLGSDRIYRFRINDGALDTESREDYSMPAGCGPRHCAFGKGVLYVSTELSDEVLVLSWPGMELIHRITVNDAHPSGGGHLTLSPDGRFLYASSRLENDGIAVFRVLPGGGLERIAYSHTGSHPRHFCLTPDGEGLLCACRDDNAVQLFRRLPDGTLERSCECYEIEKPVFVEAYEKD